MRRGKSRGNGANIGWDARARRETGTRRGREVDVGLCVVARVCVGAWGDVRLWAGIHAHCPHGGSITSQLKETMFLNGRIRPLLDG